MESGNELKWRKQDLKPIDTSRRSSSSKREEKVEEEENKNSQKTGEEEPLSPSSRLFHESNFNIYVIAIMGCKTRIYPDVFKANLSHTSLRHPRFSSLQVMDERNKGEMKWLDPNIYSPENFFEDYIYNLSKTSIDKSQPLWDLHLLNLRTSESEAIGVFRVQNSLGDGTSLMSLLLACTRQMNDPLALPTVPIKKQEKKNDHIWFWRTTSMFWSSFRVFLNTMVDVFMFIATALFLKDTQNPLKGPSRAKFAQKFNLQTINDVALGITQAGLSRYINKIYGGNNKDEGAIEMDNLPKKIHLRSTLLINIRPSAGIQPLADMMEKDAKAKWGNWIGYVLLPFTIAIRDDPLDYVRDAKATIDRKKRSLEAIFTFYQAALTAHEVCMQLLKHNTAVVFHFTATALSHRILSRTTVCSSNLVGPLEEIGFYGHPMAFLAPSSSGLLHVSVSFESSYNVVQEVSPIRSFDEGGFTGPRRGRL
ncbi:hypothetical protein ES332_A07G160000v1 [Gossypium tomentosum]|uniref:O-acyltransferase WSD1 C-terminal domain-containing protein n=1 Tax=Gossypium tomentosum TaxID=34277 RepID=A0A5D2PTZ9_GOSTO|nr:hypothetical protein ES332_A07G160000v1 [Gossypium tomentosum]